MLATNPQLDCTPFLSALFGQLDANEAVNVRCLGRATTDDFYPSVEAAAASAQRVTDGQNVYMAVNPRVNSDGTKNGVRRVVALHADLDPPAGDAGDYERRAQWKAAKLAELAALALPPSAIVDSGGGLQAYWLLAQAKILPPPRDSTRPASVAAAEAPLKGLVERLGADHIAAELAHILRVPGTWNYKDKYPDGPLPVRLLELRPERRYPFDQLAAAFASPIASERRNGHAAGALIVQAPAAPSADALTALAEALAAGWNTPDQQGNTQRHVLALAVAGWLQSRRWSWKDAERLLREVATRAGDGELRDRLTALKTTWQRAADGEPIAGWSQLRDRLPPSTLAAAERLVDAACPRPDEDQADRTDGRERKSQATVLVELAADADLFHTVDGKAYASIAVAGHRETWPLRERGLRLWLQRRYHQARGGAPGSQAIQDALGVLEARALFDGPERAVALRVAEDDGRLYLDLANAAWEAVEIDANGWRIVAKPPVVFRRPRGTVALPMPARGGKLCTLRRFVNVRDKATWLLIVAWLVQALMPRGPYPVLNLKGQQGSAKSTAAECYAA